MTWKNGGMKVVPPVVALGWLSALALVDRALPADVRHDLKVPGVARLLGVAPLAAGVALAGWAIGLFRKRETTPEPFGTPSKLVEAGPYRYTRNPMYVGVMLSVGGVALLSGRALLLLAVLGFWLTMDRTQVPREERLLEELFGEEYRAYKTRVRRWA